MSLEIRQHGTPVPDALLLTLCADVLRQIDAHPSAASGGEVALARAGQLIVEAAALVAAEKPTTAAGIQAKARVAYVLACDGGTQPNSNGLVHTVMIALIRDLL